MRRKAGIAAVSGKKDEAIKYSVVAKKLEETKISFVHSVLSDFKITLTEFASKHRNRINSDPEFRMQFHAMCNSVGVDPLSSSKGFWADFLGIGNYYFKLGVVIIQICILLRSINGGIIRIDQLHKEIMKNPSYQSTTIEDVRKAIQKLEILGNGFKILNIGDICMVLSVPMELNKDHEEILECANIQMEEKNDVYITEEYMKSYRDWTSERFQLVIQSMLTDGLVWLDNYQGKERFYFPNFSGFK